MPRWGCQGFPRVRLGDPWGAVTAQITKPVPKCQARPEKCWKDKGEALLIPWQLQDTQTQPAGRARVPGLQTLGPQGRQLPCTRGTGSRPAGPAPGLGVR